MDSHPTLFQGKRNDSRLKMKQKRNQAPKMGTGGSEPQTQFRKNRAFGTAWNSNVIIPKKPVSDNIATKPKTTIQQKQLEQPIHTTQVPNETTTLTQPTEKKSPQNLNPINTEKSDTFSQQFTDKLTLKENDSAEPKTPVTTSHRGKSKVQVITPFYSAVNCSKCRFDKLETSSYWVGQIKLAESVGKHFVAYGFFKLALKSQAEPIRNLRIELKRYLSRHGYLWEQKEWKKVAARYGLKSESNTSGNNSQHES